MKKLFDGFKADIKFRGAGPGRRLNDEARVVPDSTVKERPALRKAPAGEAQIAAASAAIARLDSKQGKEKAPHKDTVPTPVKDVAHKQKLKVKTNSKEAGTEKDSMFNVLFRCPITGEILQMEEIESHLKKSIEMLTESDPISASIMKIYTFNKHQDKVKLGVETMARYLKNIIENPTEEKYKKIKLSNKVFQEKVICLEGAHEFLEAVGFEKKTLALQGQDLQEEFYILGSDALYRLNDLQSYQDSLLNGEPLIATLDRQPQIFVPSHQAAKFDLPDGFYNLTIDDIRLEQKLRTEKLKQDSMLRTKAMRDRGEKQQIKKYKYTVLRIRFPDGYMLQGLFYAEEQLSVLVDFIRQYLQNDWLPFELIGSCGQKLKDEQVTFNECGLLSIPSLLPSICCGTCTQGASEASTTWLPLLARFLNCKDRDQILALARRRQEIKYDNARVSIFPDFSMELQKQRATFMDAKRRLREANIPYSLGYLAKLCVVDRDRAIFFTSPGEVTEWLAMGRRSSRR